MKVKIGEAKTHLSRLVKEVNETGEPLELCVREDTVAYIVPAKHQTEAEKEYEELVKQIEKSGLILTQRGRPTYGKCPIDIPDKSRRQGNAILEIRAEKDY